MLGAIQTQKSRRNILFIYCQELSLSININTAKGRGGWSSDSMENDGDLQREMTRGLILDTRSSWLEC